METCLSAYPYHEARLNACCGFSGVHGAPGGQDARPAKIGKKSRGCKTLVHHICYLSVECLNVSLSDCQSVSCPGGGVCLLSKLLQKLLDSHRSSKKLGAVSSLTLLAPFCMSGRDISGAPPGWSRSSTFHQFQFWGRPAPAVFINFSRGKI